MTKHLHVLTARESAFAAEHHELVDRYLKKNNLSEEEFYDVVIFGYLEGVQQYFRQSILTAELFEKLAEQAMHCSYEKYMRKEYLRNREITVCSLNECRDICYTIEDRIADAKELADQAIRLTQLEDTVRSYSMTEKRIMELLMDGYSKQEIAGKLGIHMEVLSEELAVLRSKLSAGSLIPAV